MCTGMSSGTCKVCWFQVFPLICYYAASFQELGSSKVHGSLITCSAMGIYMVRVGGEVLVHIAQLKSRSGRRLINAAFGSLVDLDSPALGRPLPLTFPWMVSSHPCAPGAPRCHQLLHHSGPRSHGTGGAPCKQQENSAWVWNRRAWKERHHLKTAPSHISNTQELQDQTENGNL